MKSRGRAGGSLAKRNLPIFSQFFNLSFNLFSLARTLDTTSSHSSFRPTRQVSGEEAERWSTGTLITFCGLSTPGLPLESRNFGTTGEVTEDCVEHRYVVLAMRSSLFWRTNRSNAGTNPPRKRQGYTYTILGFIGDMLESAELWAEGPVPPGDGRGGGYYIGQIVKKV